MEFVDTEWPGCEGTRTGAASGVWVEPAGSFLRACVCRHHAQSLGQGPSLAVLLRLLHTEKGSRPKGKLGRIPRRKDVILGIANTSSGGEVLEFGGRRGLRSDKA